MKKFLFYMTIRVLSLIWSTNAIENHPYGHPISIQLSDLSNMNSNKSTESTSSKLKEIFGHPEIEDRKVVILSIIGAYRKGKSFFLDYCLRFLYANYQSINTLNYTFVKNASWWGGDDEPLLGFSWKHGSVPDTKGILFWSDVFLHEKNGEKTAIFLIDTQGLFESGRDSNLDAKVFGITSFISSIQIFNIKDVIQEDQLEHLKMITDFAELTTRRQNEKSLNSSTKAFQDLLFLFRDWDDEDVGYGYEGGQIYLNTFLNSKRSDNKAQRLRDHIKDSYDNIEAFLMPPPGKVVRKKSFSGQWGPLEDEFKDNVTALIESIFLPENLVKKKIFGKEITASQLFDFILSIFTAFKDSNLPENESVFDSAVKMEIRDLADKAVDEFMENIVKSDDYNRKNYTGELMQDYENLKIEVIKNFKNKPKMADDKIEDQFTKIIEIKIDEKFSKWKDVKIALHEIYLKKKLEEEQKLAKERYEANQRLEMERLRNAREKHEKDQQIIMERLKFQREKYERDRQMEIERQRVAMERYEKDRQMQLEREERERQIQLEIYEMEQRIKMERQELENKRQRMIKHIKSPGYGACKFFTLGIHDCGLKDI